MSSKPVHLAIIRAYNIDATRVECQRVAAFPNWREHLLDFQFTPIHRAVLEYYECDDKERPSLITLLKFMEETNTAAPGQDWAGWKRTYKHNSPLFGEIIDMFRREESRLRRHHRKDKPFLALLDEPDKLQKWTPFH